MRMLVPAACVTALAVGLVVHAQEVPRAPIDVRPGSITSEDVPYPYPVS